MKNGVLTAPCGVCKTPRRAPVASVLVTSNEKLTRQAYQRKIHASMVNRKTKAKVVPKDIPSAFPNGAFFGSAAEKPIAIRMMAQIEKTSKLPPRISCQTGALSPRNAATLDARKF